MYLTHTTFAKQSRKAERFLSSMAMIVIFLGISIKCCRFKISSLVPMKVKLTIRVGIRFSITHMYTREADLGKHREDFFFVNEFTSHFLLYLFGMMCEVTAVRGWFLPLCFDLHCSDTKVALENIELNAIFVRVTWKDVVTKMESSCYVVGGFHGVLSKGGRHKAVMSLLVIEDTKPEEEVRNLAPNWVEEIRSSITIMKLLKTLSRFLI
jgi:hypothetical protein